MEKTVENKAQEKFEKIKSPLTQVQNFTNTSSNVSIPEIISTNISEVPIP